MAQLVEFDSRQRVALGCLAKPEHDRHLAADHADGALVLTPAGVMAAHPAALLRHPELVEQIKADRVDSAGAGRLKARRLR